MVFRPHAWSRGRATIPCSLIGTGLVREGRVAVSLGTSDVIFGLMEEPRVDSTGTGHVFGAPTGAFMGLTVFKNGSLARERVRDSFGLSWPDFSRLLESTPAGNNGRIFLPWYEPEITPPVSTAGVHRYGLAEDDAPGHVRGVIEGQMMAIARHSRWMKVDVDTIYATGGASANRQILQVMADVFKARVFQLEVRNSAALGAALRARHGDGAAAGEALQWEQVIEGLVEPVAASRIEPRPAAHAVYLELMKAARGVRSARARAAGRIRPTALRAFAERHQQLPDAGIRSRRCAAAVRSIADQIDGAPGSDQCRPDQRARCRFGRRPSAQFVVAQSTKPTCTRHADVFGWQQTQPGKRDIVVVHHVPNLLAGRSRFMCRISAARARASRCRSASAVTPHTSAASPGFIPSRITSSSTSRCCGGSARNACSSLASSSPPATRSKGEGPGAVIGQSDSVAGSTSSSSAEARR